jgi:hypothetical protein
MTTATSTPADVRRPGDRALPAVKGGPAARVGGGLVTGADAGAMAGGDGFRELLLKQGAGVGGAIGAAVGNTGGVLGDDEANGGNARRAARREAHEAAAGLVSAALILPVLKQLRRSPFGENTVFSGGSGEKLFGPQFDMQLADRIAHSPRLAATNALADRIVKKTPAAKTAGRTLGLDLHG